MTRLRYMLRVNPRDLASASLDPATDVSFAPMESLRDGLGGLGELAVRPASELMAGSYNFFRDGDVLLAKVTPCFENGKKAIAHGLRNGVGFATSEVHVLRPNPAEIDTRFLAYLLSSEDFRAAGMASMTGAGGLRRVSEQAILDYRLVVTSFTQQRSIADFLDRETGRIDALIAKKERQTGLLQERFSAMRLEAVTGIGVSGERRATAMNWCPTVPNHWTVRPLRHVAYFQRGFDLPAEERLPGSVPLVSSSGITSEHSVAMAKAPGIVTGRYGTIGTFWLIESDYWPLNTTLFTLRIYEEPRFVWYLLQEMAHLFILNSLKSAVPGVDRNDLHSEYAPVPPRHEQQAITEILDHERVVLHRMQDAITSSVAKLRELRSSLITAAVTGQIDPATWGRRGSTERAIEAVDVAAEHAGVA